MILQEHGFILRTARTFIGVSLKMFSELGLAGFYSLDLGDLKSRAKEVKLKRRFQ